MHLIPTVEAPYGFLQTLHEHIIATAQPLTLQTAHHALVYPFIPFGLQAYLLQYPDTRKYRIPAGLLSVYLVCAAWKGYRFYQPWFNAGNNLFGVMFLHIIGKAVEFALLEDRVIDPWAKKGRGRLLSAFDLCANSRWIGLRPVGMEQREPEPQAATAAAEGKQTADAKARWLPRSAYRRTRRQAFLRHLRLATTYLLTIVTLLHLLGHFGRDTLALSHVPSGGFDKFFDDSFLLLPRTRLATPAPAWFMDLAVKAFLGGGVYTLLVGGYHLAGAMMVGSGMYETEAWEVDLFGDPLGAESVLEFWGKGWHQVFRHHFNLVSLFIVSHLHLHRLLLLPIAFALSGALHAICQISMSPSPSPSALFLFFLAQSLGCLAEIAFKRATGRKVGGWAGWIWKAAFLSVTSGLAVRTELESGLGGTVFMPDLGGGRFLTGLITRYIVDRP